MLIEFANKTIIAVRLATLASFSGKYMEKFFQEENSRLTPIIRPLIREFIRYMQHIRERRAIHPSQLFNPDHQGMEVKIDGYKARRLQVPALRQDFLREERA